MTDCRLSKSLICQKLGQNLNKPKNKLKWWKKLNSQKLHAIEILFKWYWKGGAHYEGENNVYSFLLSPLLESHGERKKNEGMRWVSKPRLVVRGFCCLSIPEPFWCLTQKKLPTNIYLRKLKLLPLQDS